MTKSTAWMNNGLLAARSSRLVAEVPLLPSSRARARFASSYKGCWSHACMSIDDLLRIAMERRASDLHLKVGNYPHLRVDGDLFPLTDQPRVSAEDMLTMAFSMMSARQKQKFKETTELDMAYGVAGLGRFRVNVFQQRGNVGLVLRVIPTKIRTTEELNLPPVISKICEEQRGLVLVTGTTGSGKSTTLAAIIDRINANRSDHLITIEDPSNSCTAIRRVSSTSAKSKWIPPTFPRHCALLCVR